MRSETQRGAATYHGARSSSGTYKSIFGGGSTLDFFNSMLRLSRRRDIEVGSDLLTVAISESVRKSEEGHCYVVGFSVLLVLLWSIMFRLTANIKILRIKFVLEKCACCF